MGIRHLKLVEFKIVDCLMWPRDGILVPVMHHGCDIFCILTIRVWDWPSKSNGDRLSCVIVIGTCCLYVSWFVANDHHSTPKWNLIMTQSPGTFFIVRTKKIMTKYVEYHLHRWKILYCRSKCYWGQKLLTLPKWVKTVSVINISAKIPSVVSEGMDYLDEYH